MNKSYQKGVSALFAILILSIMMAMVLGLTTIVSTQVRTIKSIGDSVIAFYAADAGIEYMIRFIINEPPDTIPPNVAYVFPAPNSNISYEIDVVCCIPGLGSCVAGSCPAQLSPDPIGVCAAPRYCIKSVGIYSSGSTGQSRKALEVEI